MSDHPYWWHEVYERSNGHKWVKPPANRTPGDFCRLCLMMKRSDGKNGTCTGAARFNLRQRKKGSSK